MKKQNLAAKLDHEPTSDTKTAPRKNEEPLLSLEQCYASVREKLASFWASQGEKNHCNWLPPIENEGDYYDSNMDPHAELPLLGRIPYFRSCDIPVSMLGIGFETLDRETFNPEDTFEFLSHSGIKRARCQTGWIRCEIAPGEYDFSWLDQVVDGLANIGIKAWLSLSFGHPDYTPCDAFKQEWDAVESGKKPANGWARGYVGQPPIYHGEKAMTAWHNYVVALVEHFKGRVDEYEVWNEAEGFWQKNGERLLEKIGVRQAAQDYTEFDGLARGEWLLDRSETSGY